jgi:hypothetical protein
MACIVTAWRSHSRKIEIRVGSQLISVLCPAVLDTLGERLTTFHFQSMDSINLRLGSMSAGARGKQITLHIIEVCIE